MGIIFLLHVETVNVHIIVILMCFFFGSLVQIQQLLVPIMHFLMRTRIKSIQFLVFLGFGDQALRSTRITHVPVVGPHLILPNTWLRWHSILWKQSFHLHFQLSLKKRLLLLQSLYLRHITVRSHPSRFWQFYHFFVVFFVLENTPIVTGGRLDVKAFLRHI